MEVEGEGERWVYCLCFQPQQSTTNYGPENETGRTWLSGMVVVVVVHLLMWSSRRPWLLAIQIRLAAQAQVCLYAEELSLGVFPGCVT